MDLVYELASSKTKSGSRQTIPQWKMELAKLPALTTQQAACAFAGVDYYEFKFNPDPSDEELKVDKVQAENLLRWLRVIEKAAGNHELPAENIRNADGDEYDIWMFSQGDFAAWCHSKGVVCPIPINASESGSVESIELDAAKAKIAELEVELKNATSKIAAMNSLNFGNHETELLRKLAAATDRFWKRYDLSDNTTAPTNQQVIDWLKQQGVAERTAEVMATILRADGLPTGPRK